MKITRALLILFLCLVFAGPSCSDANLVGNGSFEAPLIPSGGVWCPVSGSFSGWEAAGSSVGFVKKANWGLGLLPEGNQCVFVSGGNITAFLQDIVKPNTTYDLSVWLGSDNYAKPNPYDIELGCVDEAAYAAKNRNNWFLMSKNDNVLSPALSTWNEVKLTYTSPAVNDPVNGGPIGKHLSVYLKGGTYGSAWTYFDNVVLTETSVPSHTGLWLSEDTSGIPINGEIRLDNGVSKTFYCFLNSNEIGNAFDVFVGYDKSTATAYGSGNLSDSVSGKLTLLSSKADITASISQSFNVIRSNGYPETAVSTNASAREDSNIFLGGKPFGFSVSEATMFNADPGKVQLFSFTLKNQMTVNNDYQYVVISSNGGDSYSSAWKYARNLSNASCSVKIVNVGTSKPVIGSTIKAVFDAAAMNALGNYAWALSGKVSGVTANTFELDDGSGIKVLVNASSHGLTNEDSVEVRGDLTVSGQQAVLDSYTVTRYGQIQ